MKHTPIPYQIFGGKDQVRNAEGEFIAKRIERFDILDKCKQALAQAGRGE